MKVQIVMPTINLWNKYTKQAIESVEKAMVYAKGHQVDCRFLLIDNASSDETRDEASKKVSELFSHMRNETRWGFQTSVNTGVKDGFDRGFDFILVCNNDIVLHPEAIWRLVQRFQAGDVGMVTCMDVRGEMQDKKIDPLNIDQLNAKEKEDVDEAPNPNFSAFMVSKECWHIVGEFDEVFYPAYFEDNDYHYRMNLLDVKSVIFPPAMFFHYGSRTQNEANENGLPFVSGGSFENNRANYTKKWGGVPGQEKFDHPYNDPLKAVSVTKQSDVL